MQRFVSEYEIEDKVVLVTDPNSLVRIISAIEFRKGHVGYQLCCGIEATWHDSFEFVKVEEVVPE